jgi:glycosyltransferase involved in cell wall biosynthesis
VSTLAGPPFRVLIYEPYPFGKIAGNLRTLLYILRWTDPARFRLTLIVPFETSLLDRARALGVDVLVLQPPSRIGRYGGKVLSAGIGERFLEVVDLARYNRKLYRLLRKLRTDVIYCNGIRALLTVSLAGAFAGVPRLWYVKGALENPVLDRLGFLLARRILFFAVANRDDRYPWLTWLCRRKIGIVGIGLDLEAIRLAAAADKSSLTEEFSLDADTLGIGYLGQLYPLKGIHFLLEAFGRVARDFPASRLFLIGDSVITEYVTYENTLRDRVRSMGLEERVIFTGWREDALTLASRMAIVVHPALSEGFGRAILESMALGVPVIATSVGGVREVIRDGENGYLTRPGDVDALSDRLRRLLGDADLRHTLGNAGRDAVSSAFRIQDKIEALSGEWVRAARRPGRLEALAEE